MKRLIKKILKEEIELLDFNQDPLTPNEELGTSTVILVGGLDTGSYKNIEKQKTLLEKGLGANFKVFAHRWTNTSDAKKSIILYPKSYVVLFSKGCEFATSLSDELQSNGGYLNRMYIVEPYSCSKGTKSIVETAISKGVPKKNVLGGSTDCTGNNVAGTKTLCSSQGKEFHWCALTEVGEKISKL
jgi:hypothetical protein